MSQHCDDILTAIDKLHGILNPPCIKPVETSKPKHNSKLPQVAPTAKAQSNNNSYHKQSKNITSTSQSNVKIPAPTHCYNTRSKAASRPLAHTNKLEATNAMLNTNTRKLEEYRQLWVGKNKQIWTHSFSNELG